MGGETTTPEDAEWDSEELLRVEVGGEELGIVKRGDLLEWVEEIYQKRGYEVPIFYDSTEPSTGKDQILVEVREIGPVACGEEIDAAVVALNDIYHGDTRITPVEEK